MICPYFKEGVCQHGDPEAHNQTVYTTNGSVIECGIGGMIVYLQAQLEGRAPCVDLSRVKHPVMSYGVGAAGAVSAD